MNHIGTDNTAAGDPILHLEELALSAWPALKTLFLDGWIIRLSDGYTKRANSVVPLYPGTNEVGHKIDYCERVYNENRLPAAFKLPDTSANRRVDLLLAGRGFHRVDETIVQTLDSLEKPFSAGRNVEIGDRHSTDWFEGYCSCSGLTNAAKKATAQSLLGLIVPKVIVVRKITAVRTIGCGFGVLHPQIVGLFDIVVDREFRHRGVGTEIVAAILHRATQMGAKGAYLQVTAINEPAIRLYRNFGFKEAYRYFYRVQAVQK